MTTWIARTMALLVVAALMVKPCVGLLSKPAHAAAATGTAEIKIQSDDVRCKSRCLLARLEKVSEFKLSGDVRRCSGDDGSRDLHCGERLGDIVNAAAIAMASPAGMALPSRVRLALLSRLLH